MENLPLIVLDDGKIASMLNDASFLAEFKNIKMALESGRARAAAAPKKAGCKPCQAKARNVAVDLMSVKKSIARMSDEDKIKMKKLLKTEKIRIVFKAEDGKLVQLTF